MRHVVHAPETISTVWHPEEIWDYILVRHQKNDEHFKRPYQSHEQNIGVQVYVYFKKIILQNNEHRHMPMGLNRLVFQYKYNT